VTVATQANISPHKPGSRSRARALVALVLRLDVGGVCRKIVTGISGSPPLLPAGLQPRPRPAGAKPVSRASVAPRIWMIGTTLRLDGAPLSQFELARGLAAAGFDVSVFVKEDGPLRERYSASGIPVDLMPELACSASVPDWYEADVALLAARLRTGAPDLIIASTIDAFAAIEAARIAGISSLWNIRESEPWRARLADRHTTIAARALAAFSYPAAVIFVAGAAMKSWQDFVPAERRHLIYNASAQRADTHDEASRLVTRTQLGIAPGEQMAVSVGTLCERKSQVDFARAIAIAPASIRPVFVGGAEPGYRQKVEAALGPALPRAIFTGSIPDAGAMIAAADALVCSSRSEAFPRTLLEAASLGTPIIATALDGTQERLIHGESALLYPPGEVASLARLLERIVRDPSPWSGLAETAHARLTQAWTHADMIAAYAALVRKALS
jgi:glycosyltransferase involved in cell wall biosynthesis